MNMLTHSYIPLTKDEFFKYLGLRLAMACEPKRGAIPVYWDEGYSLAQYTVVQALVNALGCPEIDLRTLLSAGLPKASPACQVGLPGRTFSLAWQAGP